MREFEPKLKKKVLSKATIGRYVYIGVLALLLIGGISYGYTFFIQNKKITSGSITTANLTINFTDRNINATGLSVPGTDNEGLTEYIKSLTITNQTNVDGKVKLTLTRTSGLALNDLSYAILVNGAIQEISNVPSNGEIFTTAIFGNETMNIKIMLWPKTSYSGSGTTFVGEITPEIKYLGNTAVKSISSPAGKYVNFNCNNGTCEVWQIVKVENGRLVLTRQADYSGATSRTNSNRYKPNSFNPAITFNDDSMITSLSTDGLNVYLAKTVKIDSGTGTLQDPYNLIINDFKEEDKKVIAVITYKDNNNTTIGTQNVYYGQTNYVSQVIDNSAYQKWTDGTANYNTTDTISFTTDTVLTTIPNLASMIMAKCNDSNVEYVQKYNSTQNGAAIDTPDGSGNSDVCYYTTTSSARNSDAEQNGNVIFGDYCWLIVRTTADGGVKLLYNGPKTNDNKCPSDADTTNYSSNPRPSSIGVYGFEGVKNKTISGDKLYGTSFEIFNDGVSNEFRLLNTFTANWNGDYDNDGDLDYPKIIGNYVCGTSSSATGEGSTCSTLYYVGHYQSETEASVERYDATQNSHYSRIGSSSYNAYYDSPALVGYMYNDVYNYKSKTNFKTSSSVINRGFPFGSWVYGDSAVWVNDHYELRGTQTQLWSDIYSSAQGMYTCTYHSTSCETVRYIVGSDSSFMYYISLSNNENSNKTETWTIGTGYEENNGVYTLTGTSTLTITLKDWYTNYSNSQYKGFYICDNRTSSTCTSEVYYVGDTSNYQIIYNNVSNSYVFGNSVDYQNGSYTILNTNTQADNTKYQTIWDWYKSYNTINNSHYTCFTNSNTCESVYFVYYTDATSAYYIVLKNGERITDALQKMFNKDNTNVSQVNKYNSAIKGVIDSWYASNLSTLSSYLDDNAVYCNDRTITSYGGWSANGSTTNNYELKFKYNNTPTKTNASLGCTNITDRFSKNNTVAQLSYPIGLLSEAERAMMYVGYTITGDFLTGNKYWWTGSPDYSAYSFTYINNVWPYGAQNAIYKVNGVRPAIVLKPGVEITSGNGTYNTPYLIKTTNS